MSFFMIYLHTENTCVLKNVSHKILVFVLSKKNPFSFLTKNILHLLISSWCSFGVCGVFKKKGWERKFTKHLWAFFFNVILSNFRLYCLKTVLMGDKNRAVLSRECGRASSSSSIR